MTGKKKNEIWAVILSIVVILEMILSPCQVAYASTPKSSNKKTSQTKAVQEEEAYTVKVTDSKQQPIKGAKISYEIYTDATGESVKENVLNLSVMTDAEGTAKILPISTLQKQDSEVYYRITEISAYGYEVYKDEEVQVVNAENVLTERDFVLSETKVSLTGRVTNQSDNTPLEGALVTAGEESTYTNENGDYTILLFFNTEYEMVFSMDGFESATTKFTITGQNSKCNAKLTKSPVYDPNFIFETENPETIIYGTNDNKFSNPAISAVGTEISVKYAITEEKNTDGKDADVAEIDEKTGEVTIKKAGTVKVEATRAGDAEYDETKISYTLTILKANQTGVKFKEQSPKDCYLVDLKNKGYTNILEGGESSGSVTYKITKGQDFATIDVKTGKLTFKKAGTVEVTGTKAGDDCYESQSAAYSITTLKKNQTDGAFKFEITNPSEITYNPNENKFVNTASGGEGNGKVTYQIIQGNEVADIDSNSGELTINKAGTVKVQATKIEDEDYESATAVYTLEVSKAQQNNLHFVHAKTEISWNQNGNKYGNELDGGSGTGTVSYKIVSEKNLEEKEVQTGTVATINAESGELAILSTGSIEVQAIKAGDDCYEEAAATYKLTINKATQKIEFAEKNISLYYGKTDYAQSAKEVEIPEAADGKGVGTGSIAYSIDGENPLNAKIDKKTGKVTFVDGKIGTITVKAVKAEDEKYQKCETSYQLQVSYLKTSENLYTLSGEKADAKNDWYIGNIKITAKDGYQISYSNKLKENNWTTSVTYDTEGTTDTNIYLREEATGAITDAVKLSELKIDKGNPTNLKIEYKKESLIDKFKGFLFGKKEAEVILTAKDDVSGIASFKYQYQSNIISLSSKGQDETEVKFDSSDKNWKKNEDGTVSYTFKIKPQFRGNVSFKAIDNAGNVSTQIEDRENTVVVDDTKPEVNISYQAVNGAELKATVEKDTDEKITRNNVDQIDENTRFIYNGTVEATIEVKEANFFKEDVPLVIKRDGKEIWNGAIEKAQEEKDSYSISDWTVDEKNDKATCTIQLKADGDYQVGIAGYQDRAGNEMKYKDGYISNIITVDTTAPELKVTYDNNDVITNADEDYYQSDRTATVQVTDRNFRPSEVDFSVISKNVQGKNVTYQYSDLKDWGDWKLVNKNTSTWEAEIPFNVDARYDVSFKYTDLAGHELTKNLDEKFVVDKTDPEISVRYSDEVKTWKKVLHAITFGYYTYQADLKVTLTAKDETAGVDYIEWAYNQEENTSKINKDKIEEKVLHDKLKFSDDKSTATTEFTLTASETEQFRGSMSYSVTDRANRSKSEKEDNIIRIVDNIAPIVDISYTPVDKKTALKSMVEKDTDSEITRATVEKENVNDDTRFIYDGAVKATIKVKEANFFDKDAIITLTRDGKKIYSGPVTKAKSEKGSYSISEWKKAGQDTVSCEITFEKDGDYQLKMDYSDSSDNEMSYTSDEYENKEGTKEYTSNIITVDTVKPQVKVTYDNNSAKNGNYYKNNRTATICVTERNFRPSEVDFSAISKNVQGKNVTYQYSDLKDWDDWKLVNKNTSTWAAEVPFNVDARYDVNFKYTDLAGHNLEKDFADAFIVDKEAPNLNDMKISYSTHIKTWQKVLHAITFGYYSYKEEVEVTLTAKDDISGIDYLTWTYKQEANTSSVNVKGRTETISRKDLTFSEDGKTATGKFKLKATNKEQFRGSISFIATDMAGNDSQVKNDSERVNIVDNISPTRQVLYPQAKQIVDADTLLTKSEYNYGEGTNSILYYDGDVTVTFKVTEANFYAEDVDIRVNNKEQAPTNWQQSGDTWTGSITLSGDGDYVITMTYTDRSTNQMQTYQSEKIVIDTINPVINVSYGNGDVKKTAGERQYFNKVQTATISITEHNFRADDVAAVVTAKDVNGADVSVTDFARYLSNRGNWTRNGDVYSANITYDTDANYTFDIDYKDLALRNAADYKEDQFTVDKTAPSNLKISYSEPVKNQTIGALPYRFYKQLVTVTISAEDNTSGVEHFVYSYRKASGVSSVNAELIDAALANSQITKNGSKFTSSFTIPRSALGNNNQFNGTVDFVAHDTATNTTDLKDSSRTVVDNISPTASVTYNKPVQEVNGISYYSGKIDVTVQINEANFYAEDVQISVAKDGANGNAMTASWSNNSTDVHTGTFSLSEDGDYIITINYTDRSTNKMETYTSKQLTIDTKHPTIHVSNIKANSANKDETYGFTITATDTADNFTSKEFKPVLEAVTRSENGSYEKKEIPLGDINTNKNNQEYSITVENLEEDGIYTLTCSAKDLANNEYKKFTLDDGEEYESVSFSINRNGSTFLINKDTENLINQYYVYDVNEDLVISEINTDPVENYTVKLNGKELEEDTEYTTETSSPEDEWSVRKYTIDKDLFDTEGEYNIVVESVDKTETSAYSDVKGLNLSWVVDQTAPIVAVSGLENDGRYKTKEQVVTAIPTDDGGKLKSFKVVVSDKNKKNSSKSGTTLVDLTGDKLEKYLDENDGKVTFKVPEGYQENVRIICTDYAAHKNESETNTYDKVFSKVTVSPSNVVIFYANKPLFYGSIAGVIVVLGGGIIFFIWRRRRENGKQQEE